MTGQQSPPEITRVLLETKGLKDKSVPWKNIELPIDFLLLTVNQCEFLSCLSFLNPGFSKSYHKSLGFVFFGDIGEDEASKQKIALMKCSGGSTGPGGSTVAVQNAVAVLRPKAVINVGYCASLNREKAKLGDVVVSAKLTTYAPVKVGENGDIEELGHSVPPKKRLADLIKCVDDGWEAPLQNPGELRVKVDRDGVFLSGPEEVKSQERCAQLRKRFQNAVAIEMEGEGLYAASHARDIEWIMIKGISEYADGSSVSSDAWRRFASVMAASLTVNMLSEPIVFQTWPHYGEADCPRPAQVRPPEQNGRTVPSGSGRENNNVRVKAGTPSDDDLEELADKLSDTWEKVGRRLGFEQARLTAYHKENERLSEKAFKMLLDWKKSKGSDGTYQDLYDALCHKLVKCKLIAEEVCCDKNQSLQPEK